VLAHQLFENTPWWDFDEIAQQIVVVKENYEWNDDCKHFQYKLSIKVIRYKWKDNSHCVEYLAAQLKQLLPARYSWSFKKI
jgi:hypothetical protein